ncbi:uncharacterized protein PAC_12111 [Phialocephala subalpina]|uniref:MobA-like NTP transferase domain-containing protein n=1 Tax=Phialocephala subalpina TaxID=576137 RepID=A0A1L7XB11_9HELO|nr:uncharacterized protein PAC_12111 [Phialocephala subalpina]
MDFDTKGPLLKPLLLIGVQASRMGTRKELLPFPDGSLAFEHALSSLHSALPSASTIYISLHSSSQQAGIQFRLNDPASLFTSNTPSSHEDHHYISTPSLQVILDNPAQGIGPAAGLLAAHSLHPEAKWLVLGCDYPLLPPSALQQLILEYKDPLTCFVNEEGFVEPLIGIWSPDALGKLKENVGDGNSGLSAVVKEMGGKMVKPLREGWIQGFDTREEWEEVLRVLKGVETGL